MRYSDLKNVQFFISDDTEHAGDLEAGEIDARLSSSQIEAQLEQHRPEHCCPRAKSLLLHERPVGDGIYCYKVSPLDGVDRTHMGWLKLLAQADPSQQGVIAHNASLFWKGLECKEHLSEPWEFRTSVVRVLKRVGASSRDTLVTPKATI